MSDNSLNAALQSMTPPSRLLNQSTATRQPTSNRIHHKWTSENIPANDNASSLKRNLFTPQKAPLKSNNTTVSTPLRGKTPQRNLHRATPKRSNSGEYCGLTAEITRELHSRSVQKTHRAVMSKSINDAGYVSFGMNSGLQTPPRSARKDNDIFTKKEISGLGLTPTFSNSSDDISPTDVNTQPLSTTSSAAYHAPPTKTPKLPPSSSKPKRGLTTPIRMKNKIFSAKKLKKCLTPPREGFASHLRQLRNSSKKLLPSEDEIESNGAPPSSPASLISTALPGADEFKIHSTEYDPFDFQCELPQKKEIATHGKICNLVDSYTGIHLNFNFAMLAGLTRGTLENEYERSTAEKPMIAGACHRDVIKSILECEDDLIVEGFFREYVGDNDSVVSNGKTPVKATPVKSANKPARDDRIEAIIFSSEKLRQIIVCFRGSTASQAKPLKMNYFGKDGKRLHLVVLEFL